MKRKRKLNHSKRVQSKPFKKENEMNAKLSKISFSILAAILLALGLALAPLQTARAATCPVTSALDDLSAGTLRAMLADVTCATITFAGDTTINLASTLTIDRNMTIDGGTN